MITSTTEEGQQPEDWGTPVEDLPADLQTVIEEQSTDDELSLDDIFGLLKNQRRREVLQYLRTEDDGTTEVSDLAEHIAAKENDIAITQLSSDQRKRVYIALYQCHLPKMEDVGVIDYDQDRGTVELCETIAQFEPYLDDGTETDGLLLTVELGIAGGVVTGVTGSALGLGPLAAIPALAWTVVSTVALAAGALYQLAPAQNPRQGERRADDRTEEE